MFILSLIKKIWKRSLTKFFFTESSLKSIDFSLPQWRFVFILSNWGERAIWVKEWWKLKCKWTPNRSLGVHWQWNLYAVFKFSEDQSLKPLYRGNSGKHQRGFKRRHNHFVRGLDERIGFLKPCHAGGGCLLIFGMEMDWFLQGMGHLVLK